MTGYGRATASVGSHAITVRVSSLNRRSLDITATLPSAWAEMEPAVLERVRHALVRGKVHVLVEASGGPGDGDSAGDPVAETLERLGGIARAHGIPFEPTTELLWQIVNARRAEAELPPVESAMPLIIDALQRALREFKIMRAKEGEALLVDFLGRLERLRVNLDTIAQRAPLVAPAYRDALLQRLRAAELDLDLGDERVLREIALFADRSDVSEEITRLRSHLRQLQDLLRANSEIGRKAEFILQEIAREIHTLGTKANDLAISQQVIEFKNELERVREQMANVE